MRGIGSESSPEDFIVAPSSPTVLRPPGLGALRVVAVVHPACAGFPFPGTTQKVPSTRSTSYRCSLPGLAGFASVPSPGTSLPFGIAGACAPGGSAFVPATSSTSYDLSTSFPGVSCFRCLPPITQGGGLGVESPLEGKVHGSIRTQMGRRSNRRLVAFAAAFVLTGTIAGQAGTAVAAEAGLSKPKPVRKTPTPQPRPDLVAAKQAYEEALRAFNLGQWDEAVAGFQKSYKLSGDAALLFNVAQAQRQAGHVKEAIIAYKAFLREKPETPRREMIEAKLKELESATEAKTAVAKPRESPAPTDQLTDTWEDPFAPKPGTLPAPTDSHAPTTGSKAQALPSSAPTSTAAELPVPGESRPAETPVALPVAPSTPGLVETPPAPPSASPGSPEPSALSVAPPARLPAAEPVLTSSPPPADTGKLAARQEALDLRQKPASEESAAATGSGSRWWLWTGIGAVVAAGVVTAVVLSTRGPQRDGTCPSGFDGCLQVGK